MATIRECCGAPSDAPHTRDCRYSSPATLPTGGPFTLKRSRLYWTVQARVFKHTAEGTIGRDRPTFFLDADVQGIGTADAAVRIARDVLGIPADAWVAVRVRDFIPGLTAAVITVSPFSVPTVPADGE